SRPPSLPPNCLIPRLRPLRCCWPMTAGGPDKVEMSPILSLSCAPAGQAETAHSAKAAKARSNNAISIFPRGDAELPDGDCFPPPRLLERENLRLHDAFCLRI